MLIRAVIISLICVQNMLLFIDVTFCSVVGGIKHCWLGHLTRKVVPDMTYNVFGWMPNPT